MSFFSRFVPSDGQKIILTAQKHWESIRNGIVDLRKRYHDHEKRQRADFQKSAVLGGVKKNIPKYTDYFPLLNAPKSQTKCDLTILKIFRSAVRC